MFACSTLKMEMCCYNDTLRFMSMMWLTWVMFHSAVIVGVMSDLTSVRMKYTTTLSRTSFSLFKFFSSLSNENIFYHLCHRMPQHGGKNRSKQHLY